MGVPIVVLTARRMGLSAMVELRAARHAGLTQTAHQGSNARTSTVSHGVSLTAAIDAMMASELAMARRDDEA